MLRLVRAGSSPYLAFEELEQVPSLFHLFTIRESLGGDSGEEPLSRFLARLQRPGRLVSMHQMHGCAIHWANPDIPSKDLQGDGLLTSLPDVLLVVRTADCLPIILVDPVRRRAGNLHAGWRGTLLNITGAAVMEMVRHGSLASDLLIAFGPSIGPCCYEVGSEVADRFRPLFDRGVDGPESAGGIHEAGNADQKPHLDLGAINRHQAVRAGVRPERILSCAYCTRCRPDLFYSYRRDGNGTGRMYSLVGIV